jgi:biotin synthase
MPENLKQKILGGGSVTRDEARQISEISGQNIFDLFASANTIRNHFRGNRAGLCAIVNAKSGACPEDCDFCSQSAKSRAQIAVYPLLNRETILQKAVEAKQHGARRFSIVTSGKRLSMDALAEIAETISAIRDAGIIPCASLGMVNKEELLMLKTAGLDRYHHNLETSKNFFPRICSTHSYADKEKTLHAVKAAGLSICSGGIFGMGETWQDRIDMAFSLKDLGVDSVPLNFLIPVRGTPLEDRPLLHPLEALKIVSLYRFVLPDKEIRVCGGRRQVLGEFNSMVFLAGADCLLIGNYLTTTGREYDDDRALIETYGLAAD